MYVRGTQLFPRQTNISLAAVGILHPLIASTPVLHVPGVLQMTEKRLSPSTQTRSST